MSEANKKPSRFVYDHNGVLIDLKASKVISIYVMKELRLLLDKNTRSLSSFRHAVVRCVSCRTTKSTSRTTRVQISLQSKQRRLSCPHCGKLTAYASELSILDSSESDDPKLDAIV